MVSEQRVWLVLAKSIMRCVLLLAITVCGMFVRLRPIRFGDRT